MRECVYDIIIWNDTFVSQQHMRHIVVTGRRKVPRGGKVLDEGALPYHAACLRHLQAREAWYGDQRRLIDMRVLPVSTFQKMIIKTRYLHKTEQQAYDSFDLP